MSINIHGKGTITLNGYRAISKGKRGEAVRKYEHRMIMEAYLGRELTQDEHVHHINGNKLDNRVENLQVITKSEHERLHAIERRLGHDRVGISPTNTLAKNIREKMIEMLSLGIRGIDIAYELSVSPQVVSKYKKGFTPCQ